MTIEVTLAAEVADAIASGLPVVALESTIFSLLGLPAPANAEALDRCLTAVRRGGAVPAVTAVLDGRARVGVEPGDLERVLAGTRKVAERDIAVACGLGWDAGMTTVSASLALAHMAGIEVFATGGIGGVHRGVETSWDISADLDALAHRPVICVSAGAKSLLDLPRTLEYLETVGVPVLGWRTESFPAFYVRDSGLSVPHVVGSAAQVAAVHRARARDGTGLLVVNPIPEPDALDRAEIEAAIAGAVADAADAGVTGAALTPFILARIGAATAGRSVPANLALAEANAAVAAQIAVAVADRSAVNRSTGGVPERPTGGIRARQE